MKNIVNRILIGARDYLASERLQGLLFGLRLLIIGQNTSNNKKNNKYREVTLLSQVLDLREIDPNFEIYQIIKLNTKSNFRNYIDK